MSNIADDRMLGQDSEALMTYSELINNILISKKINDDERYRYEAIGLQVITDFHIHHMESIQTFKATMDDMHRINLPKDCIRVKALGYPKGGRLWKITRDDEIYTNQSLVDGNMSSDSDTVIVNPNPGQGYSTVGSNKYNFTIDYNSRQAIITGTPIIEITVYYLSSGIKVNADIFIPVEANFALQAAIIHKATIFDAKIPDFLVKRYKQEYKEEVFKLRRLYSTYTVDEWHDAFLRNSSQVVSR